MGRVLRYISYVVILAVAMSIVFIAFLFWGVMREGLISNYYGALNGIIERSIQLDHIGKVGIPLNQAYNGRSIATPPNYLDAQKKVGGLRLSEQAFSCDFDITLTPVDPRNIRPYMSAILSLSPLRYVAVFHGPAPDLTPFFSKEEGEKLMGSRPLYYERAEGKSTPNPITSDDRQHYRVLMSKHPKGMEWSAFECDNFSYIEIDAK